MLPQHSPSTPQPSHLNMLHPCTLTPNLITRPSPVLKFCVCSGGHFLLKPLTTPELDSLVFSFWRKPTSPRALLLAACSHIPYTWQGDRYLLESASEPTSLVLSKNPCAPKFRPSGCTTGYPGHSSSPSWKTLAPDSYSLQCYSWEIWGDSSIRVHSPHSTLASGFLNFPSSTESLSAPTPVGTCLALSSRTVLMETSWIYAVQYGGHLSHLAFTRG